MSLEYELFKVRRQQLHREADDHRLLKLAMQANNKPKLSAKVLFGLGRRLAEFGMRLQARFGQGSEPARGLQRPTSERRVQTTP